MSSVSCPSCGAPLEIKTKSALVVVCRYCDSTLMRQNLNLEMIGRMAELQEDGSPLRIGVTGRFREVGFELVGRLQLEYPAGCWNEWYTVFSSGKVGWIGDGMGIYTVSFTVEPAPPLPPYDNLKVGQSVPIASERFEVSEVSQARCVGGAGELPFSVRSGYDLPVVDLVGAGTRFATIDYSETPPLAFAGDRVEFEELSFKGLREFEGW